MSVVLWQMFVTPKKWLRALTRTAEELDPETTVVAGAAGNLFHTRRKDQPQRFRTVIDIDLMGVFHTAHGAFDQLRKISPNLPVPEKACTSTKRSRANDGRMPPMLVYLSGLRNSFDQARRVNVTRS